MPGRILIVDDDPWILRMVSALLYKRGYEVFTASDGEQGFEKATEVHPDLVITDVMMPKMNGWELVRALRARADLAFTPVLFLTAFSGEDDRIRGFRLGVDDYLPKPFRFEELDLRVQKALERKGETPAKSEEAAASAPLAGPRVAPALRGSLGQVGLSSLLVIMEMERKSGMLQLERPGATGRLFVRDGQVVAARLDGEQAPDEARKGVGTVYHLLTWSDGDFEFSAVEVVMEDEMQTSTTHLLMEAARRMDELGR